MSIASISLTLAVATYAALVATVVGGWQIWSGLLQRRTRVKVTTYLIREEFRAISETPLELAVIKVVNESDHPVRWVHGSWRTLDGDVNDVSPVPWPRGGSLSHQIPPHDSRDMSFEAQALREALDFSRPVVAVANLSTGQEFRSEPTVLGV